MGRIWTKEEYNVDDKSSDGDEKEEEEQDAIVPLRNLSMVNGVKEEHQTNNSGNSISKPPSTLLQITKRRN